MAAFAALIAALSVAPGALGHHSGPVVRVDPSVVGTIDIPVNRYAAYEAVLATNERLTYDVRVTVGGDVDVYLAPSGGFADYQRDTSLSFVAYERFEHTREVAGEYLARDGGASVFLVVDNVDLSGAMPAGPVTVSVDLARVGPPPPPPAFYAILAVSVGVVVAIVLLGVLRIRRTPRAAPPAAPRWPPPPPPVPPGR